MAEDVKMTQQVSNEEKRSMQAWVKLQKMYGKRKMKTTLAVYKLYRKRKVLNKIMHSNSRKIQILIMISIKMVTRL